MKDLSEKNVAKVYNSFGEDDDKKDRDGDENIDSYGNEEPEDEDDDETLVFKAPSFNIVKLRRIFILD
jgi:hypothetical protein